ncbi:MAG: hypothetical protein IKP40_09060 [Clostridia bacterium]|nr:hypothetical protein [Clostridia bacterium]
MADLTVESLRTFILVLIGLAAVIVSIDKGIEVVQKWRGVKARQEREQAEERRFTTIENRLARCETRLEQGDAKFGSIEEDSRHTLMVLNAMLMHFISGNDHDRLKAVKNELDTYMTSRR